MKFAIVSKLSLVIAVVAVVGLTWPVNADHYFKQASHTDAVEMMGQVQPATDDTSSIWLSEGKSCMNAATGQSFIYVAETNMFYMIDHNKKTYAEMSADWSKMMDEMMGDATDEEKAQSAEMMKAMTEAMMGSMEITVTPTDESKEIKNWSTTKYIMEMSMPMGKTTSDMWMTKDIDIDYEAFKAVASGSMALMPGYEKVLEEMNKVEGITVYSVTEAQVMGTAVRSTMELLEHVEKDAPAGTYDIPEGYKKVDVTEMGQ